MPTIRVFEPALCCNTGVCGPDLDQALVDFTADLNHLKEQGIDIERHNLANDPTAFAGNDTVRAFLQVAGSQELPLTLVDGITVATGTYPSRSLLLQFAGVAARQPVVPAGATDLGLLNTPTGSPTGTDASCGCGPEGCS